MNMVSKILDSKKAQIGSTLTWVVAFIIIFFILALFLFFSSSLAMPKKIISSAQDVFSSDNFKQTHQTFFANSYSSALLNRELDYDSKKLTLRQVLEGYASKKYSKSFFTEFIMALNNQSFSETGFIYSTFDVNEKTIFFYGSGDCAGVGSSDFYIFTSKGTIKVETSGSKCTHYIEGKIGGEDVYWGP